MLTRRREIAGRSGGKDVTLQSERGRLEAIEAIEALADLEALVILEVLEVLVILENLAPCKKNYCMRLILTRFYGDDRITLGTLRVEGSDFECMAAEPRHREYSEAFPGCSAYCLPVGVHECKLVCSEYSPLTLAVAKCAGHRKTLFGWHPFRNVRTNTVLVGAVVDEYDTDEPLRDSERVYKRLSEMVYAAFCKGEKIVVEIKGPTQAPHPSPLPL